MGLGGINVWQLLIILIIVVLIFGTKKLKNMGGDLGSAVKSFKDSLGEGKQKEQEIEEEAEQIENKLSETTETVKDDSKTSS